MGVLTDIHGDIMVGIKSMDITEILIFNGIGSLSVEWEMVFSIWPFETMVTWWKMMYTYFRSIPQPIFYQSQLCSCWRETQKILQILEQILEELVMNSPLQYSSAARSMEATHPLGLPKVDGGPLSQLLQRQGSVNLAVAFDPLKTTIGKRAMNISDGGHHLRNGGKIWDGMAMESCGLDHSAPFPTASAPVTGDTFPRCLIPLRMPAASHVHASARAHLSALSAAGKVIERIKLVPASHVLFDHQRVVYFSDPWWLGIKMSNYFLMI